MAKTLKQFIAENALTTQLDENVGEAAENLVRLRHVRLALLPDTTRLASGTSPPNRRGDKERTAIQRHLEHIIPGTNSAEIDRSDRDTKFPEHDPLNPVNLPGAVVSRAKSFGLQGHDAVVFHIKHNPHRSNQVTGRPNFENAEEWRKHISKHLEDAGIPHIINNTREKEFPVREVHASVSIPADYVGHVIKHVMRNARPSYPVRKAQEISDDLLHTIHAPWSLKYNDRLTPSKIFTNIPPYNPRLRESTEPTRITDSLIVRDVGGGKHQVVEADKEGRYQMGERLSSNQLPYPDEDEHGLTVPHVQVRENHPKLGHTTFIFNVGRNPVKPPPMASGQPMTESKKDQKDYDPPSEDPSEDPMDIFAREAQSGPRRGEVNYHPKNKKWSAKNKSGTMMVFDNEKSARRWAQGSGPGSRLPMTEAKKPPLPKMLVGKVSKPGEPPLYMVRTSELGHPDNTELTDNDLNDLRGKAEIEIQNTNRKPRFRMGLRGWFKESEGGSDNPYA